MKTLLPLVLPLLLVACKSSQQTTQQVLHTQQTDSLALYKQRLQEQRIQLDQWQELEWELSQSPGDTLPCLAPSSTRPLLAEIKQGAQRILIAQAPHLSLKLRNVSHQKQQNQDYQQLTQHQTRQYHAHQYQSQKVHHRRPLLLWLMLLLLLGILIKRTIKY